MAAWTVLPLASKLSTGFVSWPMLTPLLALRSGQVKLKLELKFGFDAKTDAYLKAFLGKYDD